MPPLRALFFRNQTCADVSARRGLTSDAARSRLKKLGPNAIADVAQRSCVRALGKLWAPVPRMLEAAILLQLFLDDYVEAGVVAFLLIANAAIGVRSARRQGAGHA
jgi:Cation transporter/ATPase, N-terminus